MVPVRWLALAVAVAMVPSAGAHAMSEHGNVVAPVASEVAYQSGALFLCDGTTICHLPNGLVYYTVAGVQGGDDFVLIPDDGLEGPPNCESLPQRPDSQSTPAELLAYVEETRNEPWWPLCAMDIDFDVHFTGGPYRNNWGLEAGVVPGSGDAIVTLLFTGDPGEGFTYSEA